jgi:hypothetical protein
VRREKAKNVFIVSRVVRLYIEAHIEPDLRNNFNSCY